MHYWNLPSLPAWNLSAYRGIKGDDAPNVKFQYSSDGESWHNEYTDGDIYMRTSNDGGNTWTAAMEFAQDLSEYAKKNGYYEEMAVGLAENLISPDGVTDSDSYIMRTTAGNTSVGSGNASMMSLKGRTLVWNQLLNHNNVSNIETGYSVVKTSRFNEYKVTVPSNVASSTNIARIDNYNGVSYYSGKTLILIKTSTPKLGLRNGNQGDIFSSTIKTYTGNQYWYIRAKEGLPAGEYYIRVHFFNLTKMFGSGNEPTTDVFYRLFPLPSYPYTIGRLLSVNASGLKTVGFNAYDNASGIARVVHGMTYEITGNYTSLVYKRSLDDAGEELTVTEMTEGQGGQSLDPFQGFKPKRSGYVVVTGGDETTCIHLVWSGYRNGDFEDYWSRTLDLSWIAEIQSEGAALFPNGLCSAGTAYDEVTTAKAVKRVGSRAYASGDESDATVVTDGTTTYYALAEPVEVNLTDTINLSFMEDDFGTEEFVSEENGSPQMAPPTVESFYMSNLRDEVRNLPTNYISAESMEAFIEELSTALGTALNSTVSIDMDWDAENGRYSFTIDITPNETTP